MAKNRRRTKQNGGKRKRSKTRKAQQPKIVYVQTTENQQPLPQPQQPQPGVFTWGDAGKMLAVNVGAILFDKGLDEAIE